MDYSNRQLMASLLLSKGIVLPDTPPHPLDEDDDDLSGFDSPLPPIDTSQPIRVGAQLVSPGVSPIPTRRFDDVMSSHIVHESSFADVPLPEEVDTLHASRHDTLEDVRDVLEIQRSTSNEASERFTNQSQSFDVSTSGTVDRFDGFTSDLDDNLDLFRKRTFVDDEFPILLRRLQTSLEESVKAILSRTDSLDSKISRFTSTTQPALIRRIRHLCETLQTSRSDLSLLQHTHNDTLSELRLAQGQHDDLLEQKGELLSRVQTLEEEREKLRSQLLPLTAEAERTALLESELKESNSSTEHQGALLEERQKRIDELRLTESRLAERIQSLTESIETMKSELEASQDQLRSNETEITRLRFIEESLTKALNSKEEELNQTKQTLSSQSSDLAQLQRESSQTLRDLAGSEEARTQEKTKFEEELADRMSQRDQIREDFLAERVRSSQLEEQVSGLNESLTECRLDCEKQSHEIAELQGQVKRLESQILDVEDRNTSSEEDLASSKERLASALEEMESISTKLHDCTTDLANSERNCSQLAADLAAAQATKLEADGQIEKLEVVLQSERSSLHDAHANLVKARADFERILEEKRDLQRTLEKLSQVEVEKAVLAEKCSGLEDRLRTAEETRLGIETNVASLKETVQQDRATALAEKEAHRSEISDLRQQLAETSSSLSSSEAANEGLRHDLTQSRELNQQNHTEIVSLRDRLDQISEQKESLLKELATAQTRLEEKNAALDEARERYQQALSDHEKAFSSAEESRRSTIEKLQGQLVELQEHLEDQRRTAEKEKEDARTTLETLRQTCLENEAELRDELHKCQNLADVTNARLEDKTEQLAALTESRDALSSQLEAQVETSRADEAKSSAELSSLRTQLVKCQTELDQTTTADESHREQIEVLRGSLRDTESQRDRFAEESGSLQKQLETTSTQLQERVEEVQRLDSLRSEAVTEGTQLATKLARAEEKLQFADTSLRSRQVELAELKEELERTATEKEAISAELGGQCREKDVQIVGLNESLRKVEDRIREVTDLKNRLESRFATLKTESDQKLATMSVEMDGISTQIREKDLVCGAVREDLRRAEERLALETDLRAKEESRHRDELADLNERLDAVRGDRLSVVDIHRSEIDELRDLHERALLEKDVEHQRQLDRLRQVARRRRTAVGEAEDRYRRMRLWLIIVIMFIVNAMIVLWLVDDVFEYTLFGGPV